jgi:DsbC/DsbD-like thiol-disulfide interchange protein
MRRFWLTLALVLMAIPALPQAQRGRPVPVLAARGDLAAVRGKTARLLLRVTLPKGLHVQSNKPRDPNLIPTVLTVGPLKGFTIASVTYPKPVDFKQAGLPQPLAVYDNVFEIVVTLRVGAQATKGAVTLPAELRYQACNESICFAPAKATTAWSLKIT